MIEARELMQSQTPSADQGSKDQSMQVDGAEEEKQTGQAQSGHTRSRCVLAELEQTPTHSGLEAVAFCSAGIA